MHINYPKYLDVEKLPFIQPLISTSVTIAVPELQQLASLIAEYVVSKETVDTTRMLEFFQAKTPSAWISTMKARLPDVCSCLDDQPSAGKKVLEGASWIKNSPERKLFAWACMFFGYRNRQFCNSLPLGQRSRLEKDNREYYDFLGRISGVSIVERCDRLIDKRLCHTFVFGHLSWYKDVDVNQVLLVHPKDVINFLISKGFSQAKKVLPGQAVVYHTAERTAHFAKVEKIDGESGITVISKFGSQHIYRHRVGVTQFHCGNSVTFLNFPQK